MRAARSTHDDPILASEDVLPVDPSSDVPPGYTEDQRGQPGGFVADPDVMDTWATSSLTPQIATGWVDDPDLFARTFPMDLRPQGPEIIRTWLFDTVVRSWFEHKQLPWSDTTLNGWVLDPDRKKMSKSIGNVVTPMPLVEEYGADALRYWACNGRPGVDTAVDYGIMKIGRKLADQDPERVEVHVEHRGRHRGRAGGDHRAARPLAARRARGDGRRGDDRVRRVRLRAGDRARRTVLLVVLRRLRRAREGSGVRRRGRRRRPLGRGDAAHRALGAAAAVRAVLALRHRGGVVVVAGGLGTPRVMAHRGRDPDRRAPTRSCSTVAGEVLGAIRKEKSEQKVSLATPVERVVVYDTAERLDALRAALDDVRAAGRIAGDVELETGPELVVKVWLPAAPE